MNPIMLTTTEIADAAIREIVQLSLSAAPFDLFLDQLLVPGDAWFRWVAQLGQIRETRTALSGLFGRFVARAYLTKYCGFGYFEPIRADLQALAGWPSLTIRKNDSGDLPDWMTATVAGANAYAVAEAKGSHNTQGVEAALGAAKKQVGRIDIMSGTASLTTKRYALATRWSVHGRPDLDKPYLYVDDPDEGDRDPTPKETRHVARSIALGHYATLAEGFGLPGTAAALMSAKRSAPGNLALPRRELTLLSMGDKSRGPTLCAAIVPNGVVPIPGDGDIDAFRNGLLAVYGERTAILAVGEEDILNVDRLEYPTFEADQVVAPGSFWNRRRIHIDGSELAPLRDTVIKRETVP
ncbi:hypothetical protein [Methylorubrum extorquens]|uniref:Uncharacterized protein n=1 Tax=Methylorubrum extorquens (strain ATCC 14718 / DSM 1338 / JCM 2805 / NCIMB 9133 / AM1) TaxID=272630 RepID=C5ATN5_METEA|nr:hypothetical protein [Methylorubrum extorquens]ACS40559.1 Hypothetical protein MexAM1_META1p2806 [Methylorubrum extorquens AM1]MCP1541285.1 hypothetical protein [Methylorubrum extorquens]MCP1586178.1 hypothetical protein [Methylorubrum extorquens]